jgi:hypothetical protein
MSATAVSRCARCQAVVNVHWPSCLVCKAHLPQVEVAEETVSVSGDSPSAPAHPPAAPLQAGWLVVYRDRQGRLCGGADDREHGTVQACEWGWNGWTVLLTDGQRLPLSLIRSVGQIDQNGKLLAAWTVREHGLDGQGDKHGRRLDAKA